MTDGGSGGKCPGVAVPQPQSGSSSASGRHLRAVPGSNAEPADALAGVYREHVDFVVRITRQLGVPPPHVEDVVHDAFLIVHRKLPSYDGRASLRSWLYGIVRRVVMHHQRGTRRLERREKRAPKPEAAPDPELTVAQHQAAAAVERCLAMLDDAQRMVFVLAEIEGMTAPEIARALGVKLNTVYSRLRLARRKFESLMAAEGHGGST